jgi:hypothetical protein
MLLTTRSKSVPRVIAYNIFRRTTLAAATALACLAGAMAFDPPAFAGDGHEQGLSYKITVQGSTPTPRQQTDGFSGCVYIYVGGFFPIGTDLSGFEFLFSFTEIGNTTGYITPLLFEAEPAGEYTVYTLRGIGKGHEVEIGPKPKAFAFEVVDGTQITTGANFTFGFINALVDSSGVETKQSEGVVEFDIPADGGQGEGGSAATNLWAAGDETPSVVTLGKTFGVSGSGADYTMFSEYRTYSARATGIYGPR